MDFTEITLNQIVIFAAIGLAVGIGIRWWRDQQARQAAAAALAPFSPVPVPSAPVIAPTPAPAQSQTQYPGYFDPLAHARWEAIQHHRALNLAVEDLTAVRMLELRADAGVVMELDQQALIAQHMQAMRGYRPNLAPFPSAPTPAPAPTTVNVNTPATSPVMAETPK
jgi:hypothetical protein